MKYRQTPSQLIDLPDYIQREYNGFNEWYICSQFDEAVLIIGSAIEAKTYERDDKGEELYTIQGILDGALRGTDKPKEVTKLSRDDGRIRPKPQVNPNL